MRDPIRTAAVSAFLVTLYRDRVVARALDVDEFCTKSRRERQKAPSENWQAVTAASTEIMTLALASNHNLLDSIGDIGRSEGRKEGRVLRERKRRSGNKGRLGECLEGWIVCVCVGEREWQRTITSMIGRARIGVSERRHSQEAVFEGRLRDRSNGKFSEPTRSTDSSEKASSGSSSSPSVKLLCGKTKEKDLRECECDAPAR